MSSTKASWWGLGGTWRSCRCLDIADSLDVLLSPRYFVRSKLASLRYVDLHITFCELSTSSHCSNGGWVGLLSEALFASQHIHC